MHAFISINSLYIHNIDEYVVVEFLKQSQVTAPFYQQREVSKELNIV